MTPQDFPDFDFKPKQNSSKTSKTKNLFHQIVQFCDKKWGKNSKASTALRNLEKSIQEDKNLDGLTGLKQKKSQTDNLNLVLTLVLVFTLLLVWKRGFPLLNEIDQLKNDIQEQAQVMQMEEQNMAFLQKIQEDRNGLQLNLNKVYAAIPEGDEQAEGIISMLEDMGQDNSIIIDSISIRKLPESQLNYDDLWGVVDVYEYSFSVESGLPQILNFIAALRSSLRIMDVMSLDIEEGKNGSYRGNFSLHAYHLVSI